MSWFADELPLWDTEVAFTQESYACDFPSNFYTEGHMVYLHGT